MKIKCPIIKTKVDVTSNVFSTARVETKILFYNSNILKDDFFVVLKIIFSSFKKLRYAMLDSEEMFYKAEDLRVQLCLSNTELSQDLASK